MRGILTEEYFQQITVLIVDDHEMVAESLARILRDEPDLEVVGTANTGAAALAQASAASPDVVIMDFHLPDEDGISVSARLRAVLPDVKVVILTGGGSSGALLSAMRAGCSAYLEKTTVSRELADVVRRVHAGELVMPVAALASLPKLEELALVYEPIIDLDSMQIVAFEALVRWNHPERGPLAPREFISVVEDSDMIFDLGMWVRIQAARQLVNWQRSYPRKPVLGVNVNLSPRELASPGLVDSIANLLSDTGLEDGLTLEITETAIVNSSPTLAATMAAIRALGVHIALDDFGTGYSSLDHFRRFPIDVIKIDKSFIDDLSSGSRSRSFVETIYGLARDLGAITIAEGIEHESQAAYLRNLGPMFAQGYHFYRPRSVDQIDVILSTEATA